MPRSIKPEDKPVSIAVDQAMTPTQYVILDAAGIKRAWFIDKEDAEEFTEAANAEPELMQDDMRDTGTGRDDPDREQPKGKDMPRGTPKKKTKKKATKKAAVVKKAVQKTMKRRKKRKA